MYKRVDAYGNDVQAVLQSLQEDGSDSTDVGKDLSELGLLPESRPLSPPPAPNAHSGRSARRKSLIQDLQYLSSIRDLDKRSGSESISRIEMSNVVPIGGLILGRFHMIEQELLTVIEIWGDRSRLRVASNIAPIDPDLSHDLSRLRAKGCRGFMEYLSQDERAQINKRAQRYAGASKQRDSLRFDRSSSRSRSRSQSRSSRKEGKEKPRSPPEMELVMEGSDEECEMHSISGRGYDQDGSACSTKSSRTGPQSNSVGPGARGFLAFFEGSPLSSSPRSPATAVSARAAPSQDRDT